MTRDNIRKDMWNIAGIFGGLMGLTSAAYMFITLAFDKIDMPGILSSGLALVLWTAKFVGCIWLMKETMKRYAKLDESISNKDTFKIGCITAILSALVFSAISFANVAYISADLYSEQVELMMEQLVPLMDSNTMTQMQKAVENLPQLTFVSNLIYCIIYGTVLSAILSRRVPSKDPFAEYKPNEQ